MYRWKNTGAAGQLIRVIVARCNKLCSPRQLNKAKRFLPKQSTHNLLVTSSNADIIFIAIILELVVVLAFANGEIIMKINNNCCEIIITMNFKEMARCNFFFLFSR